MANEKQEKAILSDGSELIYVVKPNPPRGGMKHTYFTPDKQLAIQFFNEKKNAEDPKIHARLEKILGPYNPTLPQTKGGALGNSEQTANYFVAIYCWPIATVSYPEYGIVCPAYPSNFKFGEDSVKPGVKLKLSGKDKKSTWFTSSTSKYLADKEKGNFQKMICLSIALARAIRRLHSAGLAHTDLSGNNVLIDPTTGSCAVIDIDSLVVPGLFPPEVIGTRGYIAPEVLSTMELDFHDPAKNLPCVRTDLFALPVLLYEFFLKRHPLVGPKCHSEDPEEDDYLSFGPKALFIEHPLDKTNRPKDLYVTIDDLGPELSKLFMKAFVDGLHSPSKRPTAASWERGLVRTWDLLQPCSNPKCPDGWFVCYDVKNPVCPFCGARVSATMHLKLKKTMKGKHGQWQTVGEINLYDKMPLFLWHFLANNFPDEKATDRMMKAYIMYRHGEWYLVNKGLEGMLSPAGNLVPTGQAVWLYDGATFLSCNHPDALLIEVIRG